jgi:hypothetical protein
MQYYVPGAAQAQPPQFNWGEIEAQAFAPYQAYRANVLGRLSAMERYDPRFMRAAMQGYEPAYGRYVLGGIGDPATEAQGSFEQYLGGGMTPSAEAIASGWGDIVSASRRYLGSPGMYSAIEGAGDPSQTTMGYIQGDPRDQIALAQAAMGMPTRGIMGGLARSGLEGQYGRWQDMIADPTATYFGRPEAGFAGWLAGRQAAGGPGYSAPGTISSPVATTAAYMPFDPVVAAGSGG